MRYKHVYAVCAYKDSPYLERCIRSLKAQTAPSPIIICTSTPSPYMDRMAWKYGLQVYVRQGKSNIRDDWNFAYSMADAELVTIAHQDDMYHREYGVCLMDAYRKYPDMTVFTTDYVIVKNGRLITGDAMLWIKRILRLPLRFPVMNDRTWVKKLALILGNPICCPATTYQKKALGEPLVDSKYQFALDWDNMVRLAGEPGRFICAERPLLYYRVHEDAATKACIADNRREQEEREMFRCFWPGPVADLIMGFYKTAYGEYD